MNTQSITEQADDRPILAGTAEDVRPRLRALWGAVAPAWNEHADHLEARHAGSTDELLASISLRGGERVLDLACGAGGTGLAAAPLVAPGEVVLSDIVPAMTAIAAQRARDQAIRNVSTCVLDLERIEQPDASYDVVLCREGLMFVPDPSAALHEMRRILRPGGRVGLSVWGPRSRNPWLSLIFDAVSAPRPTAPAMASCSPASRCSRRAASPPPPSIEAARVFTCVLTLFRSHGAQTRRDGRFPPVFRPAPVRSPPARVLGP